MYKVKIINKKAPAGFSSVVEHKSFDSREEALAFLAPYLGNRDGLHGILEDYSLIAK
jgi:hypothetical protein